MMTLTFPAAVSILDLPLQKTGARFETRKRKGATTDSTTKDADRFFYILPKITQFRRVNPFAMAGIVGVANLFATSQTNMNRHQNIETFAGGTFSTIRKGTIQ